MRHLPVLLPLLLAACASQAEPEAPDAPAEPAPPVEAQAPPSKAPPPAKAPADDDSPEALLARLRLPDAPEKVCTADADCTTVKITCCAPLEAVHVDHRATFDVARDNPMCQRVRCAQPPPRLARCVDQRCTAVPE